MTPLQPLNGTGQKGELAQVMFLKGFSSSIGATRRGF
jgi:hypothetical protein